MSKLEQAKGEGRFNLSEVSPEILGISPRNEDPSEANTIDKNMAQRYNQRVPENNRKL
jgi:hypothetical protein